MTILSLRVDVRFSASIFDTAKEAVALADRMLVNVRFEFNGIPCWAAPGMTAEHVVSLWETATGQSRVAE